MGTGGTRDKVVVENADDNCLYYFKTSLNKGEKDYTYEFWSEIIESEVGQMLGFNTLRYDVAANKQKLGCLSKLMIDTSCEQLDEGFKCTTSDVVALRFCKVSFFSGFSAARSHL